MNIIALQPLDWMNAVYAPIILMFTLGAVLAIYTGLIASRVFAFDQARYRALIWVLVQDRGMKVEHTSAHDFYIEFSRSIIPVIIEFRALGHENAVQALGAIVTAYTKKSTEILNIKYSNTRLPNFPNTMTKEEALAFMVQIQRFSLTRLSEDIATVTELKPSLLAFISIIPFPNYITYKRRLIGFFIRRKTRWDFIQAYLNGDAPDWK